MKIKLEYKPYKIKGWDLFQNYIIVTIAHSTFEHRESQRANTFNPKRFSCLIIELLQEGLTLSED